MKKRIIILTFFIILTVIGCKKSDDESSKNKKMKSTDNVETIFAVNTTKAVEGEINDYIELNGDVKAKNEVAVYADTSGKVASFKVNLGERVGKNQILAYIDPSRPGMQYKLSPVRSTISGVVTSLPVKIGETVSIQTPVAKVGNIKQIEIVTSVSEKYIEKMKLGLKVIVKSSAFPSDTFNAVVTEVSPVIDPVTRMMEIKMSMTDDDVKLKPGMFTEIKIITESKDNIVKIPAECIVKRYGDFYVFLINRTDNDEATVTLKKVKLGIQIEDKVEIAEGLFPDKEIVSRGQTLLEDKSKVRIINTIQPLSKEDVIQ